MDIPPLVKARPQMQEGTVLDNVLSKCLASKPGKRFQNVDELSFAIDEARSELERIERAKKTAEASTSAHQTARSTILLILQVMALLLCVFFRVL